VQREKSEKGTGNSKKQKGIISNLFRLFKSTIARQKP